MRRSGCYIAFTFFSLWHSFTQAQGIFDVDNFAPAVIQTPDTSAVPAVYISRLNHISIDSSYNLFAKRFGSAVDSKYTKINRWINDRNDSLQMKFRGFFFLNGRLDSIDRKSIWVTSQYEKLMSTTSNAFEKTTHQGHWATDLKIMESPISTKTFLPSRLQIPGQGKFTTMNFPASVANPYDALKENLQTVKAGKAAISKGQLPDELGYAGHTAKLAEQIDVERGHLGDVADLSPSVTNAQEIVKPEFKNLDDLAEKQLAEIEEVKAVQSAAEQGIAKEEEYKKLVAQYKDEKKIKAELKAKSVDQATEIVTKYQGKVDASMSRISKLSKRFPQVTDMRYLPKHAPNPLKGVGWRERLVPGFTFQTMTSTATWAEIDPQVYYRINHKWSAGLGGMYRFSVNVKRATVSDLDNLKGGKVFLQYHAFKGFYLRAEGQFVKWKPWDMKFIDPNFTDQTYVAAAGIGKGFQITKKIKGSSQALYHFHWNGADPYRPKVMIRVGIDISMKKREVRSWNQQFKELKKKGLTLEREQKSRERELIKTGQSRILKRLTK